MDAYTRFLTLENVRNFILYIIENDLFCNDFFIGFFMDLFSDVYTPYQLSCLNMCNIGLSFVPSAIKHTCLLPVHIVEMFVCNPLMYCYDIEPRGNMRTCINTWVHCGDVCGLCVVKYVCCHDYLQTQIELESNNARRFLSRVQHYLLKPKHHRVLLSYPPYVEYTINSSIFGCTKFNNAWKQQSIINPHNNVMPIPYNENAFFDFILSPTHQIQILLHAMTHGNDCCKFCGNIDAFWIGIFSPMISPHYNQNVSNNVQFILQCGQIKTYHMHYRAVKKLIEAHYNNHPTQSPDFHAVLCKMCAYRDFVTFYPRMKCILPMLHEMIYHDFDETCVVNHVFGNEYVARQIFNFL